MLAATARPKARKYEPVNPSYPSPLPENAATAMPVAVP